MRLTKLKVHNVRNIEALAIEPGAGLNIITGENGSGKTTLLEAIHIAGVGRSFRSRRAETVITDGQQSLSVYAEVEGERGTHRLGVAKSRQDEGNTIRINGQNRPNASELAALLPLQVISPESHELVDGGPQERRAFLDWGLFHVEPSFHRVWLEYQRALKQRNAALRNGDPRPWSKILVDSGTELDRLRRGYVESLRNAATPMLEELLAGVHVSIEYRGGWSLGLSLEEALKAGETRDRERGYTGAGPHRGELALRTELGGARETLSRGQKKLAIYGLKLGQIALLSEHTGVRAIVLLDDLPAELDPSRRTWLLRMVGRFGLQTFVTSTDEDAVPSDAWPERRVFHVKQGRLDKVV